MQTPEITVQDLDTVLKAGKKPVLLDVREANELENSRLEGIVHIPMGEVPGRLSELDKNAEIVVVCRTGGRSGRITDFLLSSGFTNVKNMVGGMNEWASTIDTTMTVY
ncbi:MAG: rhodanese-like domain-containing protein [Armatimonadetes bacterium]|nr:rhodanese-like domain-containing protein [Armatimonadota bacterium]